MRPPSGSKFGHPKCITWYYPQAQIQVLKRVRFLFYSDSPQSKSETLWQNHTVLRRAALSGAGKGRRTELDWGGGGDF